MIFFKPHISRSPLSPHFEKYLTVSRQQPGRMLTSTRLSGYIPPPLRLAHLSGQKAFLAFRDEALPAAYDLRKEKKLTPVKDQGLAGTCWAFAAYGSLESCLLPGDTWDFSENNMKNLLSEACPEGYDRPADGGGNEWMATAYLARWNGPVTEAQDPYNPSGTNCKQFLPVKHIKNVVYIPERRSPLDNTNLKLAIKNLGAVFSSMFFDDGYYQEKNAAYYASGGEVPNHAICLVGWDNNYPRKRFKSTPPGDGAFIARNSWGKEWGEDGYFYISYYDLWIGKFNAVFSKAETPSSTDVIHQYDPLGWVASIGFSQPTAWFANIFTVQADELLTGCSFYNASPDASYSLYVYKGVQPSQPRSGDMVLNLSGTISEPSYFIRKLSPTISLNQGQRFSIVIKLTTPGYNYPVPAELPIPGYSSKAQSQPGQGFISDKGKNWSDVYEAEQNASICLKALARRKKN